MSGTGHGVFPGVRHFVLGEAEGVIDQLIGDLRRGAPLVREPFLKSSLGVWNSGRLSYWALLWSTLIASPAKFRTAIELSIFGYPFHKVAEHP